jgi:hypothetical protein
MNVFTFRAKSISISVFGWVFALFGAMLLTGCGRNDVATYRVPKETAEPAMASGSPHGDMMGGHGDAMATPKIQYKTPEGWQEAPVKGGMRAAQFSITNNAGQEAEVAVIPMPGASGVSGEIVNMWRDQLGLKSEIPGTAVEIGSSQGQLYDMASTEPLIDKKFKARIMSALLKQGETVWIFKMAGEDELVRQQKPAFLAFLKSIQFTGVSEPTETASAPMTAAAPAGTPQKPTWEPPATWKEEAPSQMVLAKYALGKENAQAEVTVSAFPGDVGGLLANVNRWRGQISLPQIEQADLSKQITSFDVLGGRATLVDMTGTNRTGQKARLIGAIVPRGDQTWFYKMLGDDQVVGGEKDAFVKWVQSVKYAQ